VKYTTSANRQSNNQSKRTNLCKVIIKKAIREFLPNTERGRDIGICSENRELRVEG
jgi:ribosomal protein L13